MSAVIVLVGATGAGKSQLGNLLLDPEQVRHRNYSDEEPFQTGSGGDRVTTKPVTREIIVENKKFRIMDTPGMQESDSADVLNVRDLLVKFKEYQEIAAIFFVYTIRTERNFKELTRFYGRLFSKDLLERNMVLVNTRIPEGGQGDCPPEIRIKNNQNDADKVKNVLGLRTAPPVVSIDSRPDAGSDARWRVTLDKRKYLFRMALGMTHIKVDNLRVPKLDSMMTRDKHIADNMLRLIDDKVTKIDNPSPEEESILRDISALEANLSNVEANISYYNNTLAEQDSSERVKVASQYSYAFRVFDPCIITARSELYKIIPGSDGYDFTPDDDGDTWDVSSKGDYYVTVEARPKSLMGCTGGYLHLYAHKSTVYADSISTLKASLDREEKRIEEIKGEISRKLEMSKTVKQHFTEKLNNEIATLRTQRDELLDTHLSVDRMMKDELLQDYLS